MPYTQYNGSGNLQNIVYNGNNLEKMVLNGTVVFDKAFTSHVAYNGSTFSGALRDGMLTDVKNINGSTYSIVQNYERGSYNQLTPESQRAITAGALTTTAHDTGSAGWTATAGFVTKSAVDLTPIKQIKITLLRNADSGMWGAWGPNFADVNPAQIRIIKNGTVTQINYDESTQRIYVGDTFTSTFNVTGYSGEYYIEIYNYDTYGSTNDNHEYYWNLTYTKIELVT